MVLPVGGGNLPRIGDRARPVQPFPPINSWIGSLFHHGSADRCMFLLRFYGDDLYGDEVLCPIQHHIDDGRRQPDKRMHAGESDERELHEPDRRREDELATPMPVRDLGAVPRLGSASEVVVRWTEL